MKKLIVITFMFFIISLLALTIMCVMELTAPNNERVYHQVNMQSSNKNQVIETTNNDYYVVTTAERYLLAKLVHSEASICSEECKRDVVSVIFNRLESGKWCKDVNNDSKITIYDIIYYPNAFTPATTGAIDDWEPTAEDYAAVDYVIKHGPTIPTEVRYFRTDYDFNWDGYKNYKVLDNVYFGYFEDWRNGAW